MAQNFSTFKAQREARAQFTTENGEFFAWYKNPENEQAASWKMRFNSASDFEAYKEATDKIFQEAGMAPAELMTGTEADFQKAVKAWQRKHDRARDAEYNKKADFEISRYSAVMELLEALPAILKKFEGKVINKRLHDAIKEATGFNSDINSTAWEFHNYGGSWPYNNRPYVTLYDTGINGAYRLEGEPLAKVLAKIDEQKARHEEYIANLEATKGKYMAYVRKVNELATMINKLEAETYYTIREFAKQQYDLKTCHASYIWK